MRTYAQQKAGLTRALKTGSHDKVRAETRRAMDEWASAEWKAKYGTNAWPDDWARWQRALDDSAGHWARTVDMQNMY
jgi:hypothetical protein